MKRLLLAAALALLLPGAADAFFAPGATVVSASPERRELADDASQVSAVSADGRFAVFQTRATNLFADDDADAPGTDRLGGVFRRELGSDALATVASGDEVAESDGSLIELGARNPSVSADGRYVAFSTAYGLVPADTNGAVDVYVRDMTIPAAQAGAYTLVSARDGSDAGATYATSSDPQGVRAGAELWPLTSISADGRTVAFRTNVPSDLPAAATPTVPAGQLYVRNLDTRTTRLVTRARSDGAPAGGAFGPVALSADGAAIVWTGANAKAQTPFLDGEPYADTDAYYLWQRLADGPAAPTRRITGIVDLDDPGCSPSVTVTADPTATGPCYGPLSTPDQGTSSISASPLAISGDGWRVWFLTAAFPRPTALSSSVLDLFSTDLRQTRKAGTAELTREGAVDDTTASAGIDGMTVTPDGRWLAFTTARTRFTGGRLVLTGPPRAVPDTRELYLSDLTTGATERVVTGYTGADASGGSVGTQVSIAADGQRLGFVSGASNLFFGDANARTDAFVATRTEPPATDDPLPPDDAVNDAVDTTPAPEEPGLRVRVSRAKGRSRAVVLRITVPAAGRVGVQARGRVPGAGGKRTRLRTFAAGSATAKAPRTVRVTLTAGKAFRRPLKRFRHLNASARITFTPAAKGAKIVVARKVRFLPVKRKATT